MAIVIIKLLVQSSLIGPTVKTICRYIKYSNKLKIIAENVK